MSESAELIIDTVDDIDDENILFLTPKHIRGVRYCASNIFDYASIKNCPTEKLNSGSLIGVFNSLKPGAEVNIVVNQPISVMLEYDSKQIEANLRLVGFENIKYEEKNISDEKSGAGLLVGSLTATKPVNKEKDTHIEIIKSEKQYSYRNKSDRKKDFDRDREDRGFRTQKKIEEIREEPSSSRYKKTRYGNTSFNTEESNQKKYNRFTKNDEEDQKEVVVKEERRVRPKRYGYSKEEKPQIIETKTEIIKTKGGDNRPGETSSTTKEIVIEKTTVVDKSAEIENKKAGLRKRYGKH